MINPIEKVYLTYFQAKQSIQKQGYRYQGNDNYKENKIYYFKKGRKTLIIQGVPQSFLDAGSMEIGTKWVVSSW
jgi:hypothetical protein